jgi:drug/metabolite transporter (DMT)-like permease
VFTAGGTGHTGRVTTELQTPVTRSTDRARGTVLILLASFCFGTSGPLAKPMMSAGWSPLQMVSLRIGLAAVILLAVVGLARPAALRVSRSDWRLVVAYGLVSVAAVQLLYFAAVSRIPIGIAMLLEFTAPILVALWVRFVRGTVLPAQAWVGTVLALLGLAMVAQVWQGLAFDALGLLAGIGAALGAAAYFLLGERGVGTIEPLGLVTWGMAIGAVAIWIVVPPWTVPTEVLDAVTTFGPWHPPVWLLLAAIVLLSTAIAYLLSTAAMRHLPANVVSVLALSEPVVAITIAWVFLGQALTPVQFIGAAVLLGGATLVQISARRPLLTPG